MDIPEIPYQESFGLPQPDWEQFRGRVEALPGDVDLNALWTEAARRWLLELGRNLGREYCLEESESFLLLSAREKRLRRQLLDTGERTLGCLRELLGELEDTQVVGKFACIAFRSRDSYYSYISHFYSEGRWGASGGVFVPQGYQHFALNHGDPWFQEIAFVHELTHEIVNERGLPLWVEEGITQLAETSVSPRDLLHDVDRREAELQRSFWRRRGLGGFWSGESFFVPRSMDPSYTLARILISNMIGRGREKYVEFVKAAKREDAGDAASRSVYGWGVEEWARQFLGEGDWSPRPSEDEKEPPGPAATTD